MNCLKNSRSVLSRLLRTVSSTRPLPAQAPPGGYYYASRAFRDNVAPSPPPQVPNSRYFFTSPWAWGKKGTSSHGRRRRRGPRWYHDARKITSAVVLVAGASGGVGVVTIYLRNLEAVPYTNRTHFIILSHKFERFIGEVMFADLKKELGRKILPPLHPDSVRVHRIASEIVRAVDRGLDCRQRVEARAVMLGGSRRKDGGAAATAKRGDGEGLGAQPRISSLLDGWEVIVVRDKKVNAGSAPGGKIVLYTGLLDKLWDDAEIATVLGHEFGHAIARHVGERFTMDMWHLIVHIVTFQFIHKSSRSVIRDMSMPFLQRMETEADHIGLLLLAAAGYDPHVAPSVYEKLGKIAGDYHPSTHPSFMERVEFLSQADVMNEALELYRGSSYWDWPRH